MKTTAVSKQCNGKKKKPCNGKKKKKHEKTSKNVNAKIKILAKLKKDVKPERKMSLKAVNDWLKYKQSEK